MRILFLTTIRGFLPKFLTQDVSILRKMGFDIQYASNFHYPVYECDRPALEKQGIKCHNVSIAKNPLHFFKNLKAYRQLKALIRQESIDVILCHNPVGGLLGRLVSIGNRSLYVIYTAHGFHFYDGAPKLNWLLYYPIEKYLARRTNQLITINREDYCRAKRFRLRESGSVWQIPGVGLDQKFFQANDADTKRAIRKKLGIPETARLFLSVGELNQNKNHGTTIRAFSEANVENSMLWICGEGYCRQQLSDLIRELNLENTVKLCGYQEQIEQYYQAADVFIFPSLREGLGMAALEAMANGLPIIVADNRGTREYAHPQRNAFICKPDDILGFAAAMKTLAEDRKLAVQMGDAGREYAGSFTKECTRAVLEQVYEEMQNQLKG